MPLTGAFRGGAGDEVGVRAANSGASPLFRYNGARRAKGERPCPREGFACFLTGYLYLYELSGS